MVNVLLLAIAKALAKNMQQSSKGEEANATISPMDLIPASPGKAGTAETSTMGKVNTAPADYYKSPEAIGMKNYLKNTGEEMLNSLNPVGTAYAEDGGSMLNANLGKIVVSPNKQFNRVEPGQASGMNGGNIPEQYRGMGQGGGNLQNTQRPDVGFMRGLINAATAQPQPEGLGDVSQGRRTAYYSGELIPKIIMSKLGQSTPTEASLQQAALESRESKKPSAEYQQDLGSAVNFMKTTKLSDDEKVFMYQRLSAKYPQRSAEIRRIFFPQSQDNSMEEMMRYLQTNPIR